MATDHDEIETGRYERGWLNGTFGHDKYLIRTYKHYETEKNYAKVIEDLYDPNLSLAYVSDEKLTLLWVYDYPGWLNFCEPAGIEITPSSKISKRLTPLTKLSYLHLFKLHEEIGIMAVKPDEFSVEQVFDEDTAAKFLDGANVISRELVEEMISHGTEIIEHNFMTKFDETGRTSPEGNPYDRRRVHKNIDATGSAQIRVIFTEGIIKGDTLIVPRDQMPEGVDIMYCTENLKKEIKSHKWVFIHIEPYPPAKVLDGDIISKDVWSDHQTMSWMKDWLFPKEQLASALEDYAENALQNIRDNEFPKFFVDSNKLGDDETSVDKFQKQYLLWEKYGLGISKSIFLQERVGQAIINKMFLKRKWPLMCTMYVHVATDSWLHMAGFYDPETGEHPWPFESARTTRGYVWYHEETNRLIYNDLDFAEAYRRHGGWDLDDSLRVHARTMGGEKVFVNVRSPNSMGEYDIKKYVEGTYAPTWTRPNGEVISFPEISEDKPPFIEDLDITYDYPDGLGHEQLGVESHMGQHYTRDLVKDSLDMVMKIRTTFGGRANADMVFFWTLGDYRRNQLASIENIIDACVQEPSDEARILIEEDREKVIEEIVAAGQKVDRMLWQDRKMGYMRKDINYDDLDYTRMTMDIITYSEMYQSQFNMLAQRAVRNIDDLIFALGKVRYKHGRKIVSIFRKQGFRERGANVSSVDFYAELNDYICEKFINNLPRPERANIIFAIARDVYSREHGHDFKDNILFQTSDEFDKPSLFNYYLDALQMYGIGDPNWTVTELCTSCDVTRLYHNQVEYQRHLGLGCCTYCEYNS